MTTTYQQLPMFTVAHAGETTLLRVAPSLQVDELLQMAADLDTLQDAEWEQPFVRLTPEQLEEIERERVGADFCERPFLF